MSCTLVLKGIAKVCGIYITVLPMLICFAIKAGYRCKHEINVTSKIGLRPENISSSSTRSSKNIIENLTPSTDRALSTSETPKNTDPLLVRNRQITDLIKRCEQVDESTIAKEYIQGYLDGEFSDQFVSPYIHKSLITEQIYVGNIRAAKGIDSAFEKIPGESRKERIDDILGFVDYKKQEARQSLEKQLDSYMHFPYVLRVTNFLPALGVPAGDWSMFEPKYEELGVTCHPIPFDDDDHFWENILKENPESKISYLEEAFAFIDQARLANQPILIHCTKGASRSVAVLTAYFMNRCGVTRAEAFNFIKSRRWIAESKPSVEKALDAYEAELNSSG